VPAVKYPLDWDRRRSEVLDLDFALWSSGKDIWNHLKGLSSAQRRVLDKLRWLRLNYRTSPRKVAFRSVQKLRNLEFLSLHQRTFRNIQSLNLLDELTHLRELELRFEGSPVSLRCLPSLKSWSFWMFWGFSASIRQTLLTLWRLLKRKKAPELDVAIDPYGFNYAYRDYIAQIVYLSRTDELAYKPDM